MDHTKILSGTVHRTIPDDLRAMLAKHAKVLVVWQGLTPLARNEWICYVTSPKKPETRANHIRRVIEDLRKGKRRPCCWIWLYSPKG